MATAPATGANGVYIHNAPTLNCIADICASGAASSDSTGQADPKLSSSSLLVSPLQQSRVGRDTQRYDGESRRLLACAVITRTTLQGDREVLLISSSKHVNEWILPKGGWESDETVEQCARREAEEEAGIAGEIARPLGVLDYTTAKGKQCRFYGFELTCTHQYDHWAEHKRQRQWVTFTQASELLSSRPELLAMLQRAQDIVE